MSVTMPGVTLKQFYEEKVVCHIQQSSTSSFQLASAFLGQSKSSLDQIKLSICLSTAISNYGGFLKYVCINVYTVFINTYIYTLICTGTKLV